MARQYGEIGWTALSYNQDIDPSDHFLFPIMRKWLGGKTFCSNDEIIPQTDAFCKKFDTGNYLDGVKNLKQVGWSVRTLKRTHQEMYRLFVEMLWFVQKQIYWLTLLLLNKLYGKLSELVVIQLTIVINLLQISELDWNSVTWNVLLNWTTDLKILFWC